MSDKSNEFTTAMSANTAKEILDGFSNEIKTRCESIWSTAAHDEAVPNVTGWNVETLSDLDFDQNQARMILSRLEIKLSGGFKTWKDDVEVEHVGPQTWQDEWADVNKGGGFADDEELKTYLNRIGNRTLLDPGSNKVLGNLCLHEKQSDEDVGYDKQADDWKLTADITSDEVKIWGPDQVDDRSKKLIKKLIEIYDGDFLN